MNVLIIEDETAAAKNLINLLSDIDPEINILATIDTVVDSAQWLKNRNSEVDLIFMDIHLSDGQAFHIFDLIDVQNPIIFTTAYDQYALDAFKVNSIDYILKPLKKDDLVQALNKFKRFSKIDVANYLEHIKSVAPGNTKALLIPIKDKLIPLNIENVAFCYTFDEKVSAHTFDGEQFTIDKTLDTMMSLVSGSDFFRANRQFIISRSAIVDMSIWFGNRLSVNLNVETPERIIISKARVSEFKKWYIEG